MRFLFFIKSVVEEGEGGARIAIEGKEHGYRNTAHGNSPPFTMEDAADWQAILGDAETMSQPRSCAA